MWNTVLLVVVFSVCWRMTDGINIDMCENKTLTTNSILLVRTDKNYRKNCWCQIISETGSLTKVTFNVSTFIGQQYKLSVSKGTFPSYFESRMSPDIFYTISGSEEIKLTLEENNCSVKDGLEFVIKINSTSGNVNMTCYNPTVLTPELCTRDTSEATTISPVSTTRLVTTTSPVTTKPSVTAPTGTYTNTTSSTVEISSTEKASEATTNSKNEKTTNSTATGDLVAGLIGGLISCIIVVIVLIIVIVCIVRRKQQKEELYSQPSTVRPPPEAAYTDLNFAPSPQQPVG